MSTRLVVFSSTAAIFAAMMFIPASASAGPAGVANPSTDVSLIQNVGYAKRRWRRYHRDYDDDDGPAYVRAPFTEVDTHNGTWVAAPFVRVYTGRRGTWVRAPFVSLFDPD